MWSLCSSSSYSRESRFPILTRITSEGLFQVNFNCHLNVYQCNGVDSKKKQRKPTNRLIGRHLLIRSPYHSTELPIQCLFMPRNCSNHIYKHNTHPRTPTLWVIRVVFFRTHCIIYPKLSCSVFEKNREMFKVILSRLCRFVYHRLLTFSRRVWNMEYENYYDEYNSIPIPTRCA